MEMRWTAAPVEGSVDDFLDQAGERQKTWWKELLYGCATCAPAGLGAHLVTCIGLPAAVTSLLSSNILYRTNSLADALVYLLPDNTVTRTIIAPALSFGMSDTVLRSGLTVLFNAAAFGLLYRMRLKYKSAPIRHLNAGLFVAGAIISTSFNVGSFVQNKEAYSAWFASSTASDRQNLVQSVARPYIENAFLSWSAVQGHSCVGPHRLNQSLPDYTLTAAREIVSTTGIGLISPFTGRLTKAIYSREKTQALALP